MMCSNSPKCKKLLPSRPFACINCEIVRYCSPQCRKKHRASHLKMGCPPPETNRSLVEVCEQISEIDEGTKKRLNSEMYQRDIKEGYRWYLEWSGRDRSASNFTPEAEWALLYISIIQKLDSKIHVNHGIVHWKDGNRTNCDFSNIYFIHLCDALVHLESGCVIDVHHEIEEDDTSDTSDRERQTKFARIDMKLSSQAMSVTPKVNPVSDSCLSSDAVAKGKENLAKRDTIAESAQSYSPELNLLDDMTKEEITFLKENSDFLWIVYGKYSNHSEIPIKLTPSMDSRNSLREFQSKEFQLAQDRKKRMYNEDRRNVAFCDFIGDMSGQLVPARTYPLQQDDMESDKKPKARRKG